MVRDTSTETKGTRRQVQQNISLVSNGEESYPWRSWQSSAFNHGRKDVESWWSNQFQMSNLG